MQRQSKTKKKGRIKEVVDKNDTEAIWNQIYSLGEKTAKKFNIKSEEDVLKIIKD